MSRRLWSLSAAAALLALWGGVPEASHLTEQPRKHKVVYQLSEAGADKARFVLRNIQNHVEGVSGWKNVEAIELVVHGPALKTFVARTMDPEVKRSVETLQSQGLGFGACGNTMKAFDLRLEDLPSGARHLPQGGVVRLMELQEAGYSYIRP